jgi:hypothetical protein
MLFCKKGMTFMSSPRTAVKAVRKPVKSVTAARKSKAQAGSGSEASAQALKLAAEIERGIGSGQAAISSQAQQKLLAALCKSYAQQVQAGNAPSALGGVSAVSATDVMITASGLLKSADLQVFELGMWQSWTGR